MSDRTLFTSESVTEGHPDKVADQVSDAVLDAILAQDPFARVACETLLTTGLCVVAGEISTSAYVDINHLARQTIIGIGYDDGAMGFDGRSCGILVSLDKQSPDIAEGVDVAFEQRSGAGGEDVLNAQGAGDQGMMFGYACSDNDDFMPYRSGSRIDSRCVSPRCVAPALAVSATRRQNASHHCVRRRQTGGGRYRADLDPTRRGVDSMTTIKERRDRTRHHADAAH